MPPARFRDVSPAPVLRASPYSHRRAKSVETLLAFYNICPYLTVNDIISDKRRSKVHLQYHADFSLVEEFTCLKYLMVRQ